MPQANTRALRTRVPSQLMGKRDGLFFLWGQIERARLKIEGGDRPEAAASEGAKGNMAGEAKGSTQISIDEFIFY